MNLSTLTKLELKDLRKIDLAGLKNSLLSRPDIFINFLWIALTIFAIIFISHNYREDQSRLKDRIDKLEQKLTVLRKYQDIKKEYDAFLSQFPKMIPGDEVIDKISDFAVKRHIQILSFSPAEKQKSTFFEITNIVINIASSQYEDIVRFIHDIEEAALAMRIKRWSGRMRGQESNHLKDQRLHNQPLELTTPEDVIETSIEIQSINLKDG